MGLFGSPLKDAQKRNDANLAEMKEQFNNMFRTCRDSALANVLKSTANSLGSMGPSCDVDLYEDIDAELMDLVSKMAQDNSKGNTVSIRRNLPRVKALIAERATRSKDYNSLTKDQIKQLEKKAKDHSKRREEEATPEEDYENMMYNLQFRKQELIEQINVLRELGDEVSLSLIGNYENEIYSLNELIVTYSNQNNKEKMINTLQNLTQEKRRLLQKRVNGQDMQTILNDLSTELTRIRDEESHSDEALDKATSILRNNPNAANHQNPVQQGNKDYSAHLQGTSANKDYSAFGQNGNKAAQSQESEDLTMIVNNIEAVIGRINAGIRNVEREIEGKNDDIGDVEAELAQLLKRRDKANASEAISIDSDIDMKAEERARLIKERERFLSMRENLTRQLGVASGVLSHKKIMATTDLVNSLLGNQDMSSLAMFVHDQDEKLNLEHMDNENYDNVANSVDIERNPARGGEEFVVGEKDEHKYDYLKKELGYGDKNK